MPITRQHFDQELSTLQHKILEMATCADEMVSRAVQALIEGDLKLAEEVVEQDDIVDQFDVDIEHKCLILIAQQQPVARDLRLIGTALKIITDIERIGDYAVDIARIAQRLARAEEFYRPIADLPRLTELTRMMLHDALQAFVQHNLDLVDKVIRDDDAVDDLYRTIRNQITHILATEQGRGILALNVMFAAKYLERVSDHSVNIAERVQFIETGDLKSHVRIASPFNSSA